MTSPSPATKADSNAVRTLNRRLKLIATITAALLLAFLVFAAQQRRELRTLRDQQAHDLAEGHKLSRAIIRDTHRLQCAVDEQIARSVSRAAAEQERNFDTRTREQLVALRSELDALHAKLTATQEQMSASQVEGSEMSRRLRGLAEQVTQSRDQLSAILTDVNFSERILSLYSGGVCLIQGEYHYIEPATNKPLRFAHRERAQDATTSHVVSQAGPLTVEGTGREFVVQYTGTGFLVDRNGYVLTSAHVARPWDTNDEENALLVAAGYAPRHRVFRAFFPRYKEPFEIKIAALSEQVDIALLKCDLGGRIVPVLPCDRSHRAVAPGQTVLVVGYPTGFDVLLAKSGPGLIEELIGRRRLTFTALGAELANRGIIEPVATRGMCSHVLDERLVYDAQTATGGSGGPVINRRGQVVAVNTALLRGFNGTNFGVPIRFGLDLLDAARGNGVLLGVASPEDTALE